VRALSRLPSRQPLQAASLAQTCNGIGGDLDASTKGKFSIGVLAQRHKLLWLRASIHPTQFRNEVQIPSFSNVRVWAEVQAARWVVCSMTGGPIWLLGTRTDHTAQLSAVGWCKAVILTHRTSLQIIPIVSAAECTQQKLQAE
jgi:hypothetical protein